MIFGYSLISDMVASLPWSAGNTNPVLRYRLSQRCRDHCWSHWDRACTSVQNIILNHSGTVKALRHPEIRKDRSTTEKEPKERSCVTGVLQRSKPQVLCLAQVGFFFRRTVRSVESLGPQTQSLVVGEDVHRCPPRAKLFRQAEVH